MRVVLIVDNIHRDLPGLLLVAMRLCRYGATCYLVPFNLRESETWALAPDFVLLNYLRKRNEVFARRLMDAGIQVGVLDTEGQATLDSSAKVMTSDAELRQSVSIF